MAKVERLDPFAMNHPNNVVHLNLPSGQPAGGGNGVGHNPHVRVSALEAQLSNLATKEDIQKLKVWVLAGTIGAGVIALSVAAIFVRWLS